jgi:hypothetical protein
MKHADLIVGCFIVGFCLICFVGFTADAFDHATSIDWSGLSR